MKRVTISDRVVSKQGSLADFNDRIVGVVLTNDGSTTAKYSWNLENPNIELSAGESVVFGYDNYSLGGNKLYFDFASTTTGRKLRITLFTLSAEEAKPIC